MRALAGDVGIRPLHRQAEVVSRSRGRGGSARPSAALRLGDGGATGELLERLVDGQLLWAAWALPDAVGAAADAEPEAELRAAAGCRRRRGRGPRCARSTATTRARSRSTTPWALGRRRPRAAGLSRAV